MPTNRDKEGFIEISGFPWLLECENYCRGSLLEWWREACYETLAVLLVMS